MTIATSGFTFVRNVQLLEYPAVESIQSILPLVDEFVINVGTSDDDTLELMRSIDSPKIRILRSEWNPHTNRGGYVYAQQTNVALFNCRGRWAFYLQGDEVVHEDDLPHIGEMMRRYGTDDRVDALALRLVDFWGDYQTRMIVSPLASVFRCRIVKPHHFVMSRGDAASFTIHPKYKEKGRVPRAVETAGRLFHYCYLKSSSGTRAKRQAERSYWSERQFQDDPDDLYYTGVPRAFVGSYEGTHPAVMRRRISAYPIRLDLDSSRWRTSLTAGERKALRRHARRGGWLANAGRRECYRRVA